MRYLTKKDIKLKKRKKQSHKGQNGRVLIIGGSIDYVGAVMLAGMSSFRSGADLVVIAAPEKVAWAINTFSPDFITKKFKGDFFDLSHVKEIVELSANFDVVLIGNGLGSRKETLNFCREIIKKIKKPKVVDADCIKSIKISELNNSIITPHEGELKVFLDNNINDKKIINEIIKEKSPEKKSKIIKSYLKDFLEKNNIILLKGKTDIIISKNKIKFNKKGNEGMTKGGTGDVLAGLTAGILSQEKNSFNSACCAAFISGRIGDYLKKKKGYGFISSEMVENIPQFVMEIKND
jgi:NAD(P)H-hydrate epimerase